MKRRIHPGKIMRVTPCGAGILSDRVGMVLDWRKYSQDWIQKNEPGRYHPFDPSKEVLLQDVKSGEVFTMFDNYLLEVPR